MKTVKTQTLQFSKQWMEQQMFIHVQVQADQIELPIMKKQK